MVNGKLISVNLSDLGITRVPKDAFQECSSLRHLDLSLNRIGSIEKEAFIDLKQLETLQLQGNKFQNLPSVLFPKNNQVTIIDVSGNQLNSVPAAIRICKELKTLNLANNEIKSFGRSEFHSFSRLEQLDLHGNRMENEILMLDLPKSLRVLNLSAMGIRRLERKSFENLVHLEELNLSSNEIEVIEEGTFGALESLKILWLGENKLVFLPRDLSKCHHLTHLIISSNRLRSLPDLKKLKRLRYLVAIDNNLHVVDPSLFDLEELEEIWLSGNPSLGEDGVNLFGKEMIVQFVEKRRFRFELMQLIDSVLAELKCDSTPKEVLEREETILKEGKLISLDLSNLGIREFKLSLKLRKQLMNLKGLNLSGNRIRSINEKDFEGWGALEFLDLQDNPLEMLPAGFTQSLPHLSGLKLKGTKLPSCWRRNFIDEFDMEEFRDYFEENWKMWDLLAKTLQEAKLDVFKIIAEGETVIAAGKLVSLMIRDQTLVDASLLQLSKFSSLRKLVIRKTGLEAGCSFLSELPLEFLDLSGNRLERFEIENESLRTLLLGDNRLKKVTIKASNLRVLEVKANKLPDMDALKLDCTHLEELDISFNAIERLVIVEGSRLRRINAEGNPIRDIVIDLSNLQHLEMLNLLNTALPPDLAMLIEGRQKMMELFS